MAKDHGRAIQTLRIDGAMAANDWLVQFLADIVGVRVDRPAVIETTALGAAFLAGLGAGVYSGLDDLSALWRHERTFTATMESGGRDALLAGWREAVARVLSPAV
jgi:glycerol kinase